MKCKGIYKESETARKERLELSGCTRTRVVKNGKAYTRKTKHKGDL
jgi:hypothetical protein